MSRPPDRIDPTMGTPDSGAGSPPPGAPPPRRRRFYRRKRFWQWSGGAVALGVLLLLFAAYWLLQTVAGRDVLLAQVIARLPAGSSFTWGSAEGPVAGPLTLRDVDFRFDQIHFTAKRVTLDPDLRPLLGKRLRLDVLEIEDAALSLPPSAEEPFKLPRWPDVLPAIALPLNIQADTLVVDGFRVSQEGKRVIDVRRARGGIDVGDGYAHAERLAVDSDLGIFGVHGDYTPGSNYKTDLAATAVFPAPRGRTRARLGLIAKGNRDKMQVGIGGAAPAPLRAVLDLRGATEPDWDFRGSTQALDLSLLGIAGMTTPLSFDLSASGTQGAATLRGTVVQGEQRIVVEPSTLRIANEVLTVAPLAVQVLEGRVVLNGRADFTTPDNPVFRFAVNARGLRWGTGTEAPAVQADADLGVAGQMKDWAAIGQARLARDGQKATLDFDSRGNDVRADIKTLKASMPTGTLEATGAVDWSPLLAWTLDARLAGFDPGYFAPGWDGRIDGQFSSQGKARDPAANQGEGFDATLDIPRLTGNLRGRALDGRGKFALAGESGNGELALSLGSSRVQAKGRVGDTLDIAADLQPLQLADLLPGGAGNLSGSLKLTGPRNTPTVEADLSGTALKYDTYAAQTLSLRGRLPWKGSDGNLSLRATALQAGLALDTLSADARGAVENLQLQLAARNPMIDAALSGSARRNGANWEGGLDTLRLAPMKGDAWALQAPARFAQRGQGFTLSDSCLKATSGASLCVSADWPQQGFKAHSDALPLALVQPWLPDMDGRPLNLRGELSLDADFRPRGNAWQGEVHLASKEGGLRMGSNTRGELIRYDQFSFDVVFDPRRIEGRLGTGFAGDGYVDAKFNTGWEDFAPLNGDLYFYNSRLFWMELFSPDLVRPRGKLAGHVGLAGTRGQPALSGQAQLSEFTGELPALGITLVDGTASLDALPDGSAKITGVMKSNSSTGGQTPANGSLNIDGSLGWKGDDVPLRFNVRGDNFLVSDTTELRAVAAPDLQIQLANNVIQVGGSVTVPYAVINLEKLSEGESVSEDVVVLDPADPERAPSSLLDLDLAVTLGDKVRMNGFGLEGALSGTMKVRSRPGRSMSASGGLNVDGQYTAYGQKLNITRGELAWSNSDVSDPNINLRAEREVVSAGVTAGIDVTGRATAPRARIWSSPEMSESDALAYLVLGRSLNTASSDESQQINAASSALSAGAGLLASQLGAKIGLDDAGVLESRTLGASVFGFGKYLSPKLYVSYGVSMVGSGSVVTLKYLLRKGFNAEVESSTIETRGSLNWRKEK